MALGKVEPAVAKRWRTCGEAMVGRRIYCDDDGVFWLDRECRKQAVECNPGDYWCYRGQWAVKLPNGIRCGLSKHTITEHEDGTITASPSILMDTPNIPEWSWHGFLERGVWREV